MNDKRKHIRTAAILVEHNGKLLVLLRNKDKSEGNTWGAPAGKVENGESDIATAIRELREETGIAATEDQLTDLGVHVFDYVDLHLELASFSLKLHTPPEIIISVGEHQGFSWMTPQEICDTPNLITDFDDWLRRLNYV